MESEIPAVSIGFQSGHNVGKVPSQHPTLLYRGTGWRYAGWMLQAGLAGCYRLEICWLDVTGWRYAGWMLQVWALNKSKTMTMSRKTRQPFQSSEKLGDCSSTRETGGGRICQALFITALYQSANSCKFGALKDQMIRDRLVVSIGDKDTLSACIWRRS